MTAQSSLTLKDPVTVIPLVGQQTAQKLEMLGIKTVGDLLFYVPFRYKDTSSYGSIVQLLQAGNGMVLAQVKSVAVIRAGRYILTKAQVFDDTGKLDIVWFNQPYIRNSLKIGHRYLFEGKISAKKGFHSLSSPQFEYYDDGDDFLTDAAVALTIAHGLPGASQTSDGTNSSDAGKVKNGTSSEVLGKVTSSHQSVHLGRVTPFYEATEGLSAKWIRSRINYLKRYVNELVVDPLPQDILSQNGLCSLSDAIYKLHFPENFDEILQAHKRLGFDELLAMSLNVESARQQRRAIEAFAITLPDGAKKKLLKNVSYELTVDQETALSEILTDMAKTEPMNRLLNGDVGSGKTILAILAAYATVLSGKNAVIMAPTTILAQQHFDTFKKLLTPLKVDVYLAISGEKQKVSQKFNLHEQPSVIIGTHALLYDEGLIENIGLVVVDEQHRFGVGQREKLKNLTFQYNGKEFAPHYLTMTATPIPRTLTHVLYGDTDVSFIRTMPKERLSIKSFMTPVLKREKGFEWVRDEILKSKGEQQAFIIYPLIEESEKLDYKAAVAEYERLAKGVFHELKVGLVHGRMSSAEKDDILMKFKKHKLNVLVATSVVEVGIDIPDATIMIIENAERFGLAQLHQFRGRVGRSSKQSFCFVIPSESVKKGDKAIERLKYFAAHASGFDVAEFDLKSRGPGEVYGAVQSGLPKFKIADISDFDNVVNSRKVASILLQTKTKKELNQIVKGLFH